MAGWPPAGFLGRPVARGHRDLGVGDRRHRARAMRRLASDGEAGDGQLEDQHRSLVPAWRGDGSRCVVGRFGNHGILRRDGRARSSPPATRRRITGDARLLAAPSQTGPLAGDGPIARDGRGDRARPRRRGARGCPGGRRRARCRAPQVGGQHGRRRRHRLPAGHGRGRRGRLAGGLHPGGDRHGRVDDPRGVRLHGAGRPARGRPGQRPDAAGHLRAGRDPGQLARLAPRPRRGAGPPGPRGRRAGDRARGSDDAAPGGPPGTRGGARRGAHAGRHHGCAADAWDRVAPGGWCGRLPPRARRRGAGGDRLARLRAGEGGGPRPDPARPADARDGRCPDRGPGLHRGSGGVRGSLRRVARRAQSPRRAPRRGGGAPRPGGSPLRGHRLHVGSAARLPGRPADVHRRDRPARGRRPGAGAAVRP